MPSTLVLTPDAELQSNPNPLAMAFIHQAQANVNKQQADIKQFEKRLKQYLANLTLLKTFAATHHPEVKDVLLRYEQTERLELILKSDNSVTPLIESLAGLSEAISTSPQQELFRPILTNALNLLNDITFTTPQPRIEGRKTQNFMYTTCVLDKVTKNIQAATEFVKFPTSKMNNDKLLKATAETLDIYDDLNHPHQNRLLYGFVSAVLFTLSLVFLLNAPVFAVPTLSSILMHSIVTPLAFITTITSPFTFLASLSPIKEYQKPAYEFVDTIKQICQLGVFKPQRVDANAVQSESKQNLQEQLRYQ